MIWTIYHGQTTIVIHLNNVYIETPQTMKELVMSKAINKWIITPWYNIWDVKVLTWHQSLSRTHSSYPSASLTYPISFYLCPLLTHVQPPFSAEPPICHLISFCSNSLHMIIPATFFQRWSLRLYLKLMFAREQPENLEPIR